MRSKTLRAIVLCLACQMLLVAVSANVRLPAVLNSNMVLQQGMALPIWGWADPGEEVTVAICDQSVKAMPAGSGKWMLKLAPLTAGGPFEMTVSGKNVVTLTNVMVGEVWVCSGQSNMQMAVNGVNNAADEIAAANYPNIRLFYTKLQTADHPLDDTQGQWQACTPQTIPGFTAVGYFFGRALHKAHNVPVGLIQTAWGGTAAEAWTSRATLEAGEDLKPILDRWDQMVANYPQALADYNSKTIPDWEAAVKKAKEEGKPEPGRPWGPPGPGDANRPANLYNGMIAPLIPYGIKGAIWYQGESNAGRAYQYRTLFPDMIQDWRGRWGEGDFPFLWVQLANFMGRHENPAESGWAELREAQHMALDLPNTGEAVIIDVGDAADIHPRDKQDVGARLCLGAQKVAYGQDIAYSGPSYQYLVVEGPAIRLKFANAFGGLVAKGDGPLKGFAICGADHKWVWADARIDGDTVVVSSGQVPYPHAVRYGWDDNPGCNLYNGAGLPASPFRTDDLPGVTINNK